MSRALARASVRECTPTLDDRGYPCGPTSGSGPPKPTGCCRPADARVSVLRDERVGGELDDAVEQRGREDGRAELRGDLDEDVSPLVAVRVGRRIGHPRGLETSVRLDAAPPDEAVRPAGRLLPAARDDLAELRREGLHPRGRRDEGADREGQRLGADVRDARGPLELLGGEGR